MTNGFLSQFCGSSLYQQSIPVSEEVLKSKVQEYSEDTEKYKKSQYLCLLKFDEGLDFCLKFFCLIDQGLVPLPVSADSYNQVFQSLQNKYAGFLFWNEDGLQLEGSTAEVSKFSNCYACLTSGTTSDPKVCYLSISGARQNASSHAKSLNITSEHILLQSLPLYHSFGLVTYLWTVIETGCGLNLFKSFLGLRGLRKVTTKNQVLAISPGQLRFILKEKITDYSFLSELKILSIGGGLAAHSEVCQLQKLIPETKIFVTYGLTEAGPRALTGQWQENMKSGFIGQALGGVEIKVLNEEKEISSSGTGVLLVKSSSLKLNLKDQEMQDGYLVTRDKVEVNSKGEVYFHGRGSDLIKVGGISVYPKDVENVCRGLENVKDCLVLKKEDNLYGEVPLLFVEGAITEKEVIDFLKTRLNVYQMPRKVYIFEVFPRHSLQKINRKELLKGL